MMEAYVLKFKRTKAGTDDPRKKVIAGIMKHRCKDVSRYNLCKFQVSHGNLIAIDGRRLAWAAIDGLPPDGYYDIAKYDKERMLFIPNEEGTFPNILHPIGAIRDRKITVAPESAAGHIARDTGQIFNYHFLEDAIGTARIATVWFCSVNKSGQEIPIIVDNGMWFTLIMGMRVS